MKHARLFGFLFLVTPLFFLAAAATAADIKVRIKEWSLPASGSLPHDPAVAPDGALWYTGMQANTLGRLDPRTGAIHVSWCWRELKGNRDLLTNHDICTVLASAPLAGVLNSASGLGYGLPVPCVWQLRQPRAMV